jgi:predicted transcriptional regulator
LFSEVSVASSADPGRTVSVWFRQSVIEELDRLAAEMGRSRSWLVGYIVDQWLARSQQDRAVDLSPELVARLRAILRQAEAGETEDENK